MVPTPQRYRYGPSLKEVSLSRVASAHRREAPKTTSKVDELIAVPPPTSGRLSMDMRLGPSKRKKAMMGEGKH